MFSWNYKVEHVILRLCETGAKMLHHQNHFLVSFIPILSSIDILMVDLPNEGSLNVYAGMYRSGKLLIPDSGQG